MTAKKLKDAIFTNVSMSEIDWLVDVVIMMGAFGFGLLQLNVSANLLVPDEFIRRIIGIRSVSPSTAAMIMVALTCLPLIVRRKMPWIAFALSIFFWIFGEFFVGTFSPSLVGPLVALFTVAYERTLGESIAALVIALAAVATAPLADGTTTLSSLMFAQNMILAVAVALGGYALHNRQEYLLAAEERAEEAEALRQSEARRAEQAERTRESEAQRRVEEERVRIAREVHDITAHSLSAVSIQAAAAERMLDTDSEGARASIAAVRETAKSALDEMRAMVNVLRSGDLINGEENANANQVVNNPHQPTQGTEQLTELGKYLENAGISALINMDGYNRNQVPIYIDVALFGIAREATTNIARHSGAKNARIELATHDDTVWLIVEDDGSGFDVEKLKQTAGHGIEGMRERLNVLGGKLNLELADKGGLRISASIPLTSAGGFINAE